MIASEVNLRVRGTAGVRTNADSVGNGLDTTDGLALYYRGLLQYRTAGKCASKIESFGTTEPTLRVVIDVCGLT